MRIMLAIVLTAGSLSLAGCGENIPAVNLPVHYHPDRSDADLLNYGPDRVDTYTKVTPRDVYHYERCDWHCRSEADRIRKAERELRKERRRAEKAAERLECLQRRGGRWNEGKNRCDDNNPRHKNPRQAKPPKR